MSQNLTHKETYFGEVNAYKQKHGNGINIDQSGIIHMRSFKNGKWADGSYISIYKDKFFVGEQATIDCIKGHIVGHRSVIEYNINGTNKTNKFELTVSDT